MQTQIEKVNRYFKASMFDYHTVWTGKRDLALHFGYYDEHAVSHSKALLNMNRALARRVAVKPQDRVLDAGCGYGGSAIWLAEHIGCEVVGINVVPFQIAKAKRYVQKRDVGHLVSFVRTDYADTRLPDESFSVV